MNVDIELYRIFCEVVKYGSISKAAESVYISQSAVTQSIKKLEEQLGGKLFFRNKKGVELTEEGKVLYEYIKDSIDIIDSAKNIFSQYINLESGKIRIGGGNTWVYPLLKEPIQKFMKQYPNIQISATIGKTDDLIKDLANGKIDIVTVTLPFSNQKNSNIEYIQLEKTSYCFFASKQYLKNNPLNNFKDIEQRIVIFPQENTIKRKILEDCCKSEKIKLKPFYEIANADMMKSMVLDDIGIGFANTDTISEIKNKIEIIKEMKFDTYIDGIAILKKNMCNRATIELVNEIERYYKVNRE